MRSFGRLTLTPAVAIFLVLVSSAAQAKKQPTTPVNVNTASQEQIESLPGVGKKLAAKIIANRPYSSASDLSKAGLSQKNIQRIAPLVTFEGAGSAVAPKTPAAAASPQAQPNNERSEPSNASSNAGQMPPAPGMVWANPKTKIYHTAGDRFYGKTKHGKWMTEDDALKAGYRKSKQD